MTGLEHDGAASLRVEYLTGVSGWKRSHGWFVVRTCACHNGVPITMPLGSREDAVVAMAMLDKDARWHSYG